uniref:TGB3 n=1 Tax=Garlic virus D TaxID=12430 RepID=A0A6M2YX99_9VIRU|nr:TGB3 [Garlic virus D]
MVIVTTFDIDRARELIITNTNSCRDALLNQLQTLGVELQTTGARLDNFYSATTTSWQLIRDRLCDSSSGSRANLDTATAETRSATPNTPLTRPANRFETIEHSLESLHTKIDELASAVAQTLERPHVTPVPDEMRPSTSTRDLPAYQAQHPTRPCRAYGTVLFEDKILKIPMDITGRPVSTALKLELHLATNDQTTIVSYRIYDDGYLLLSDDIETAHKLQHRLSDCLALLHQRCPNFIYKIKGHGLC